MDRSGVIGVSEPAYERPMCIVEIDGLSWVGFLRHRERRLVAQAAEPGLAVAACNAGIGIAAEAAGLDLAVYWPRFSSHRPGMM